MLGTTGGSVGDAAATAGARVLVGSVSGRMSKGSDSWSPGEEYGRGLAIQVPSQSTGQFH